MVIFGYIIWLHLVIPASCACLSVFGEIKPLIELLIKWCHDTKTNKKQKVRLNVIRITEPIKGEQGINYT